MSLLINQVYKNIFAVVSIPIIAFQLDFGLEYAPFLGGLGQ